MSYEDTQRNTVLDRPAALRARFAGVRTATRQLVAPLSAEDCQPQSMADASPVKWHLAHTTWFFETFVLAPASPDSRPFDPQFRRTFNSYYHSVGEQHPRPQRGLLTRPDLATVWDYRDHVDAQVLDAIERGALAHELLDIVELGIHHEQQHQELILTDVKHLFAHNPALPAYAGTAPATEQNSLPPRWLSFAGGLVDIGDGGGGFAFDNETPRHRAYLQPYRLANRLVTNREYLAFIDAGGYRQSSLWLSDGWSAACDGGWQAPLYWSQSDGGWCEFTLAGLRPLRADEPVVHISLYEADAFARWAGARLPSEAEWEVAVGDTQPDGNFVESGYLHPQPAADGDDLRQCFGDVWEWTQSAYGAYPGYRPPPGAVGEYNGKFMANQFVLRGGSCATPASHVRATYRNFFPPNARWQFAGLRLASDV